MIVRPFEVEQAIDIITSEGVARVRNGFDPEYVSAEMVSPYAADPDWEGTDIQLYEGGEVGRLGSNTRGLLADCGKIAVAAGFIDWEPNYLMAKTSSHGIESHSDRTDFRHLSYFAYLKGRTDFYYRTPDMRTRQLVMNPGDMLVMRQSTNPLDRTTRVEHGVGRSGIRAFLNVSYVSDFANDSVYDAATRRPIGH